MRHLIFLVLMLNSFLGRAQEETDSIHSRMPSSLMHQSWMYNEFMSFGVYPEVQFIKGPVIGISASLAKVTQGEGAETDRGVNLGFDLAPIQRFYGPKVSVWADVFALIFPANATINMMYYFQEGRQGLYLRPEIGVGIPRLHLKYGFGFRLAGDELTGVLRHSISIGYHITFFTKRKISAMPFDKACTQCDDCFFSIEANSSLRYCIKMA